MLVDVRRMDHEVSFSARTWMFHCFKCPVEGRLSGLWFGGDVRRHQFQLFGRRLDIASLQYVLCACGL